MFDGIQNGEILKVSLFAPTREGEYETIREKTGERQNMLNWGEKSMFSLRYLVMQPDAETGTPSTHWLFRAIRRCMAAKYPEIGSVEIVDVTDKDGATLELFSKFFRSEPPGHGESLTEDDFRRVYWVRLRLCSLGPERERPEHWDPIGDTREAIKRGLGIP